MLSQKSSSRPLTLGMIPYWNLLPLKSELNRQVSQDFIVKTGAPVQVNQWLQDGLIDLAPCSSVCLASKDFDMALPLGVAAQGPVKSVYLAFHKEHEAFIPYIQNRQKILQEIFSHLVQDRQIFDSRSLAKLFWQALESIPSESSFLFPPTVRFSSASATSVMLSKIFYYMWFGKEAYEQNIIRPTIPSGRKSIELWIGDEALIHKRSFYQILDLGALWKEVTGFPFVFAVWQSRGACLNGARRRILSAGEIAESKMKIDPSSYHSMDRLPLDSQGKPILLSEYWKLLQYKLGPQEFRGLLLFLCLTRQLQSLPLGESLMIKIMRWQEMSQNDKIPTL